MFYILHFDDLQYNLQFHVSYFKFLCFETFWHGCHSVVGIVYMFLCSLLFKYIKCLCSSMEVFIKATDWSGKSRAKHVLS